MVLQEERAWIPSMGSWQTLERSSSDLIVVPMASSTSPGYSLTLWGNDTIVNEGMESLLGLALKHHFKLFPPCFAFVSFLGIDVEGFQVISGPGIEDSSPPTAGGN